jgi:hypothetical protein
MRAKFYFFTDPALLDPQTASQAYGPAGTSGGKDLFRATDLHTSSSAAPVFAICDGTICAQKDTIGTLSLILKPSQQPPFDFPFISYIIYKGIDPASLLVGGNADTGGTLDISKENINKLVKALLKTWTDNGHSGSPGREVLGLHLRADSDPIEYPTLNRNTYADSEPLDSLFFKGDPKVQLQQVYGGWRLGDFSTAKFGVEIVVERVGYWPKIELARKLETDIPVAPLQNVTYAPNDATFFKHWHDKEECLNFVDPCAFWGSFLPAPLRVWKGTAQKFEPKPGDAIYANLLFGGTGADVPGTSGNFYNRNRAYFDIRDEHGHSLNYYKAASVGNKFLVALEDGDIDAGETDYYAQQWPSCWLADSLLQGQSTTLTGQAKVHFALPKTDYSLPLCYVSVGYTIPAGAAKPLRPLAEQERFFHAPKREGSLYLEACEIAVPLVTVGSDVRFAASYQKVHHFKRFDGPAPAPSPTNLAPIAAAPLDYLLPIPGANAFPMLTNKSLVKTYADKVLVPWPSDQSFLFVARPGFAQDNANVYLFLFPTSRYLFPASSKDIAKPGPPALQVLGNFLPDYLKVKPKVFATIAVSPVVSKNTPAATTALLVHERSPGSAIDRKRLGSDFIVIALRRIDYDPVVVPDPANPVLASSAVISIAPTEVLYDLNQTSYVEALLTYSRLQAPQVIQTTDVISRQQTNPLPAVYAHEDI